MWADVLNFSSRTSNLLLWVIQLTYFDAHTSPIPNPLAAIGLTVSNLIFVQENFNKLAKWCKERNGQVIVCENTKADWLDFLPVVNNKGTRTTKTVEAIWSNHKTNYDAQQTTLQF